MITRRKLATVLASAAGAIGLGGSAAIASAPAQPETLYSFKALQKWFRDHPELLWGNRTNTQAELVRQQAVRLSEAFADAHPHIEYGAWVDWTTDNVLMKVYHRTPKDSEGLRREIGLAMAIPRSLVAQASETELSTHINEGWAALTVAADEARVDVNSQFNLREGEYYQIRGLAELKQTGGS